MDVFSEAVRITMISMPVILGFMGLVGIMLKLLMKAFPGSSEHK